MSKTDRNYLLLVLLHILIGMLLYFFPFTSKIYGYVILLLGAFFAINSQNKNNEVLYAAAYIVGSEVLLRMTDGNPVYEFSKYGVMIFIFIGVYYSGISKNAIPYWIFLLLLVPGVILTAFLMSSHLSLRRNISFNISGPVCLGVCSLYAYSRKVTLSHLNNILLVIGLPIISCVVYLILYTPAIKSLILGTDSNSALSGGFGPNQVSTILGLGMFIFVSRLIYSSKSKLSFIINLIIVLNISYRGLVTFSRGGMITGVAMILALIVVTYFRVNKPGRVKMNYIIAFVLLAFFVTWIYSSDQTGGLIDKRYGNQDVSGKIKEDRFTGRGELAEDEIETFLDNPIFGVGVARNQELRLEKRGESIVSHNELTRMLAEHGSLGIMCLLILFFTPVTLYLDNKYNTYLWCFIIFWLLTINHAAMRLAAPAFVYSLSLLKIHLDENQHTLHRE
jgi:hypothetical protein